MTTTEIEVVRAISAFALAGMTVRAAVIHNDVILTNLMTSHCFNQDPLQSYSSFDIELVGFPVREI